MIAASMVVDSEFSALIARLQQWIPRRVSKTVPGTITRTTHHTTWIGTQTPSERMLLTMMNLKSMLTMMNLKGMQKICYIV